MNQEARCLQEIAEQQQQQQILISQALQYEINERYEYQVKARCAGAMNHRMADALYRRIYSMQQQISTCARIDEYCTSQICSCGVKQGGIVIRRVVSCNWPDHPPPPAFSPQHYRNTAFPQNEQEHLLGTFYVANCPLYIHRNVNAANNQAIIAHCMLQYRQRPDCFIRPSRFPPPPTH
ncbi:hypothetical protein BDA99DRAFT_562208 [Phascolomyces articulosus]|uniref:Uncharacterized protein n=1 Tax=Phascolomyces articulosus TaxID=60185 RepID=A0AAD5K5P1_9FUNG|nr:hypothetical protein BDA99DRAFT_562208 [Phascolomyces articulosus]